MRRIGELELLAPLGRGGSASVFRARHPGTGEEMAVKILGRKVGKSLARRFLREARLLARLGHPRIVRVHEVHSEGDQLWYTLPLFPRGSLRDRLDRREVEPVTVAEALGVASDLLSALHYLEGFGVVHRDIKPDNVLIGERGEAMLGDFGLAHFRDATRLTESGNVVGTVRSMSPEQLRGDAVDRRSDLYQVGLILYEMLYGDLPFSGEESFSAAMRRASEPLPRPPAPKLAVDPGLASLVERSLAVAPDDRFPDALAMLTEVRRLAEAGLAPGLPEPTLDRPPEQFVEEFLETMAGTGSGSVTVAARVEPPEAAAAPRRDLLVGGVGGAAVAVLAIVLFSGLRGGSRWAGVRDDLGRGDPRSAARNLEVALEGFQGSAESDPELTGLLVELLPGLGRDPEGLRIGRLLLRRLAERGPVSRRAAPEVARLVEAAMDSAPGDAGLGAAEEWSRLAEKLGALSPAILIRVGRARLAADPGAVEAASRDFERALGLDPGSVEARFLLATASLAAGRRQSGREGLERVLGSEPGHPGARLGLAELLAGEETGRARAEELLADASGFAAQPATIRARRAALLARLARSRGDLEAALLRWREAVGLAPDAKSLREFAAALAAGDRGSEVLPVLVEALRMEDDDPALVHELFTRSLFHEEPAAQEYLRRLEALEPATASALVRLLGARSREAAGQRLPEGTVEAAAQKVLEARPGDTLALLTLAERDLAARRLEEATARAAEALRHYPDAPPLLMLEGRLLQAKGAPPAEVLSRWKRALVSFPDFRPAYEASMLLMARLGMQQETLDLLATRYRTRPDDLAMVSNYVEALLRFNRPAEAEAVVEEYLAIPVEKRPLPPEVFKGLKAAEPLEVRKVRELALLRPRLVRCHLQRDRWEDALAAIDLALADSKALGREPAGPGDDEARARLAIAREEMRLYPLYLRLYPTVGIEGVRCGPCPPHLRRRKDDSEAATRAEFVRLRQLVPEPQARPVPARPASPVPASTTVTGATTDPAPASDPTSAPGPVPVPMSTPPLDPVTDAASGPDGVPPTGQVLEGQADR